MWCASRGLSDQRREPACSIPCSERGSYALRRAKRVGRSARQQPSLLYGVVLLASISAADAKSRGRDLIVTEADHRSHPRSLGRWLQLVRGHPRASAEGRLHRRCPTQPASRPRIGLGSRSYQEHRGPIVLAGHSYGGAVITDAATGNANVRALVYVDAYIPDTGDTILGLTSAKPGTTLDPTKAFNVMPFGSGPGEVDLYIKPSVFRADVAGDESPRAAAVLAAEQRPLAAAALTEKSTAPAWKTIPSWALIGTEDMVLPPAEQVFMTHRAHAKTTKVKAAHLSMVTHPSLVTKIILRAVAATR